MRTRLSLIVDNEQAGAGRDCRSRLDQILGRERGQVNINFPCSAPCSADHEQNWQPYPVDPHRKYKKGKVWYDGTNDGAMFSTLNRRSIHGKINGGRRGRSGAYLFHSSVRCIASIRTN